MKNKTIRKNPIGKSETISEENYRLKNEARHISATFVHTKPIKYLVKH